VYVGSRIVLVVFYWKVTVFKNCDLVHVQSVELWLSVQFPVGTTNEKEIMIKRTVTIFDVWLFSMLEPPAQENKIRFFYNIVEEVRNIMTTSIKKDIKECKIGNSNILEHNIINVWNLKITLKFEERRD